MSPEAFFVDLRLQRWSFWLDAGRLKFRAPPGADLDSVLPELRSRKEALIELLEKHPESLEVYPLSYGQRALWFLWQLSPESIAYNQSIPLRIPPGTSYEDWKRAFESLLKRHPVLRTRFCLQKSQPVQACTSQEIDCAWIDLSTIDPAAREERVRAEHGVPFDLEKGPVARLRVFSHDGIQPSQLLLTMHHVVCDGWSNEILRQELQTLAHSATAHPTPLPSPKYTYFDYVFAEQELLAGTEGTTHRDYWHAQLATPPPPLNLPSDFPRPRNLTFDGASVSHYLEPGLHERLTALAKREGVTEFSLFLAVFLHQLHHSSGQDDFLIGSFSAGRHRAEFASVVGYFVNPLILHSVAKDGQTFREWLHQTASNAREAIAHSVVPFPWIVEKLNPPRRAAHSPFFDITYNYLSRRTVSNLQAGKQDKERPLESFELQQADGKFDLTLTILEDGGRLKITFGYNRNLYRPATVERIAATYQQLLQSFVEDPEQDIGKFPTEAPQTTPQTERVPVLTGRLQSLDTLPSFLESFERHAREHGDTDAFSDGEETLSYTELNSAASVAARRMYAAGVEAGDVVAIANRSPASFLTALLGTLKLGATYLPLDPQNYPDELLKYMVETAQTKLIVVDPEQEISFVPGTVPTLAIERTTAERLDSNESLPDISKTPESIAYIIFTSGSIARPKAVPIQRRSVDNYLHSMRADLSIEDSSRFALVSTLAADLGNTMLFLALATGGCLCIMPEAARLDPFEFRNFLTKSRIDYLKIVPSHFKALSLVEKSADLLPEKALILGGEGAPLPWIESLSKRKPSCRIFNHYGPTEATIGVLSHHWTGETTGASATLPLTRAVANAEIYLLDANLQSVPAGETGELFLAGDCLSPGYLGNREANSTHFLSLSDVRGGRVYKTGDLGRALPSGGIEILGRADRQIKLRGFRIEPVQIENALLETRQITQCVVAVRRAGSEQEQLVAFVVPASPPSAESRDAAPNFSRSLLEAAAQTLPDHMVPTRIEIVESIPLSPNGKTDLKSLFAAIESSSPAGKSGTSRNQTEQVLLDLWRQILDTPTLGIDDDFFEAGGHSLLAVKLLSKIENERRVKLPLQRLLTHTTVRRLAEQLETADLQNPKIEQSVVPIIPNEGGATILCLPGAGGSILYFNELARRLLPRFALWGIQGLGISAGTSHATIEEAASQYLQELSEASHLPPPPYILIGHSYGALVAYEMVRQAGAEASDKFRFLGLLDNPAPSAMRERGYAEWDQAAWLAHIALRMEKLYQIRLGLSSEWLRKMPAEEQLSVLRERLIEHQILASEISAKAFGHYIELYRKNAIASLCYRPEPISENIPLALFKATEADGNLGVMTETQDPSLEWTRYAPNGIEVQNVPGTHLTMMIEPHVGSLAQSLTDEIARCEGDIPELSKT